MVETGYILDSIRLGKLVHGGQCIAETNDGKRVFVWGGLPGELVNVLVTRKRKGVLEAAVDKVLEPSPSRISKLHHRDINLSIQTWSIMDFNLELESKQNILQETFIREGVDINLASFFSNDLQSAYRNKVEFSFWGDDSGIHYSHFLRATHQKTILEYPYNSLIYSSISEKAKIFIEELQSSGVRAGDLKSVTFRSETRKDLSSAKIATSLFVKSKDFLKLEFPNLAVYYSNPKSPASVATKKIYQNGETILSDKILGKEIIYDVLSFFQVNLPIFEEALKFIEKEVKSVPSIDMYSGVGAIGLSVGADTLVESKLPNIRMAEKNCKSLQTKIIHACSEEALEYIVEDKILIVDPPRAGLHKKVVEKINQVLPPKIIYLSCNPITQARDIKMLENDYEIISARGFNFFPRTPHIECLVILKKK